MKNLNAVPVSSLIILSFTILIIPLTLTLLKKKTNVQEKAAAPSILSSIDINTFRTSYVTLQRLFVRTDRIMNFSGQNYISEFDVTDTGVSPLNLGNFWAYMGTNSISSSNGDWNTPEQDRWSNWRDGFANSIMFYDTVKNYLGTSPIVPYSEGTWYPSKMVISHDWNVGGDTVNFTSVKTGIPNFRGFAMKVKITNTIPLNRPLNLNILSESMLNNMIINGTEYRNGTLEYNTDSHALVYSHPIPDEAYLAIGFDKLTVSNYKLSDNPGNAANDTIYQDFRVDGLLDSNHGSDLPGINGSQGGLLASLPVINPGESYEFTVYFVFGTNKQDALTKLNTVRNTISDIEKANDDFWNARLAALYANIPHLQVNDPQLERMYLNAFLNFPMNHYNDNAGHDFYSIGDRAYFNIFPWQFYFSSFPNTLADREGFKNSLKIVSRMELNIPKDNKFMGSKSINPYNNVGDYKFYHSFAPVSVILGLYDYLTITQDLAFLDERLSWKNDSLELAANQPVIKWMEQYAYHIEQNDWEVPDGTTSNSTPGQLVDFGADQNVYELRDLQDVPCTTLLGQYNGKTPLPNGDRYMIHKIMADVYTRRGELTKAVLENDRAQKVKEVLNSLWNTGVNWYDAIALYQPVYSNMADGWAIPSPYPTPYRNTFMASTIYNLLGYPGLIDSDKQTKLLSHLSEFRAASGFNFLSNTDEWKDKWCTRHDYYGPGLYIGDTAKIIANLFQVGRTSDAYSILNSIRYMGDSSYLGQCTDETGRFSSGPQTDCVATAYVDAASVSQIFIYGMFGVRTKTDGFQVSSSFPDELLSKGVASLTNFKMGNKIYEIVVDPVATSAVVTNLGGNNFRVRLPNKTYFFVEFNNNYLTPTPLPPTVTRTPTPTPTLTPIPTSTPRPTATLTPRPTNTPIPTPTPTRIPTSTPTRVPPTSTPRPTPTNTPRPTATMTPRPPTSIPTPTPIPCPLKTQGDANCDGAVNILDFEIWRREFLNQTGLNSDFDSNGSINILDFEVWRRGFFG